MGVDMGWGKDGKSVCIWWIAWQWQVWEVEGKNMAWETGQTGHLHTPHKLSRAFPLSQWGLTAVALSNQVRCMRAHWQTFELFMHTFRKSTSVQTLPEGITQKGKKKKVNNQGGSKFICKWCCFEKKQTNKQVIDYLKIYLKIIFVTDWCHGDVEMRKLYTVSGKDADYTIIHVRDP